MATRGKEGNSSKLPIKKILILDKNLHYEAGQQLPHRRSSHAASALSSLARTTAETRVSPTTGIMEIHAYL